ncbi:glucose 1-dehydrogenase [Rhodococcus sp. UNC363MFTsu5.1]|uniref:glucose 1-dehydrogenase n=1 Tax=Rhodococcus sp. UNC363MFTsu5.1 TaxID=1449069 RepID=UPI0004820C3E|nr:glucose 1-dehydrogenase [Rhodococcus sp. UNC363MFTsu5.1]
MGRLENKIALITGGARGMGASHVRRFVEEGAKVIFGDVLEEEGRVLQKELGGDCTFVPHDVTSEAGWSTIVDRATTEFGGLDILVNNAGILRFDTINDMDVASFKNLLDVNVVSQWIGLKYASRAMKQGGSIVNISSVNGLVGGAGVSAYSASKFAIRGITRSAALELAAAKIRVNSVHPGAVSTPMIGNNSVDDPIDENHIMSKLPIPRYGSTAEVSNLVLFLASDESSYCTGGEYVIDGGMTAGAGF